MRGYALFRFATVARNILLGGSAAKNARVPFLPHWHSARRLNTHLSAYYKPAKGCAQKRVYHIYIPSRIASTPRGGVLRFWTPAAPMKHNVISNGILNPRPRTRGTFSTSNIFQAKGSEYWSIGILEEAPCEQLLILLMEEILHQPINYIRYIRSHESPKPWKISYIHCILSWVSVKELELTYHSGYIHIYIYRVNTGVSQYINLD